MMRRVSHTRLFTFSAGLPIMRGMSRMPDFFIIGAAKSGTTSLCNYLDQHPGIFMSHPKEPSFMAFCEQPWPYAKPAMNDLVARLKITLTLEAYQNLFTNAAPAQKTGEGSVSSLDVPRSAGRIKHYAPQAKLIAILRQPADRAYSHYTMMLRNGLETVNDFRKALALEPERMAKGWYEGFAYHANGFYAKSLTRFYSLFDANRIKVFLYDDLRAEPLSFVQSIYRFLEVDDTFAPDMSKRFMEGGTRPMNSSLVRMLRSNSITKALRRHAPDLYQPMKNVAKRALIKPAVLDPDLREKLTRGYREDILRLQDMIGRDLSHWLAPAPARG
jgi:hypothetical protein